MDECKNTPNIGNYDSYSSSVYCLWNGTKCVEYESCDYPYKGDDNTNYCSYSDIACTGLPEDACEKVPKKKCIWETTCKDFTVKACADRAAAECKTFGNERLLESDSSSSSSTTYSYCLLDAANKCVEVSNDTACADRSFEDFCNDKSSCIWEATKCRDKTCKDLQCTGPKIYNLNGNLIYCKSASGCVDAVAADIKDICYKFANH